MREELPGLCTIWVGWRSFEGITRLPILCIRRVSRSGGNWAMPGYCDVARSFGNVAVALWDRQWAGLREESEGLLKERGDNPKSLVPACGTP